QVVDLYVGVEFIGTSLKSSIHRHGSSVTFNEGFRIPVTTPVTEDAITVSVWDNQSSPAKLLARGSLSFLAISTKPLHARWFNLYGFPPGESATFTSEDWRLLGENKMEGSAYLGRILLGASVQKLKDISQLLPAELTYARTQPETTPTFVTYLAEIYQVDLDKVKCEQSRRAPPRLNSDTEVQVVVSTAGYRSKTKPLPATNSPGAGGEEGHMRYTFGADNGSIPNLTAQLSGDEKFYPDVFVEVFANKGVRLGYRRFQAKDVPTASSELQASPPMWVPLNNPFAFYQSTIPGYVLLSIEKVQAENVNRRRRRKIVAAPHLIRCYLYAARYLAFVREEPDMSRRSTLAVEPGDLEALSTLADEETKNTKTRGHGKNDCLPNPYVEISCAGTNEVSPVAMRTRFPVWLHTLELNCRLMIDANDGVPVPCSVMVEVKHGAHSIGLCLADYSRLLGRKQIHGGAVERLEPSWLTLNSPDSMNKQVANVSFRGAVEARLGSMLGVVPGGSGRDETGQAGHILLGIEVLRKNDASYIAPQPVVPRLRTVRCRLSVWGLRDLLPRTKRDYNEAALTTATIDQVLDRDEVNRPYIVVVPPSYKKMSDPAYPLLPWRPMIDDKRNDRGHSYLANATWKEVEHYSAFNFHECLHFNLQIPDNPLFDPHLCVRVYDESRAFLGESSIPIFPLIPWLAKDTSRYDAAVARLVPKTTLQQNPNLSLLKEAYYIALALMRKDAALDKETKVKQAVVDKMQNAELQELYSGSTMASEADSQQSVLCPVHSLRLAQGGENQECTCDIANSAHVCGEDGIALITKQGDYMLSAAGFNVRPFGGVLKACGITIPKGSMIYEEGKHSYHGTDRLIIDGALETTLPDVYWRPIVLWRPSRINPFHEVKGGAIKIETCIEATMNNEPLDDENAQIVARTEVPSNLRSEVFSTSRFRTKYRAGGGVPDILRLRVYVIRIAAISLSMTVTKDAIYPSPHNAQYPVELIIQVSDSRQERYTSKTEGPHPKFMVFHEMDVKVPEETVLTLSAWSLAPSGPVFVGQLSVDVLERYFSEQYMEMLETSRIPIEVRPLKLIDGKNVITTGSIEMLLETFKPSLSYPRMPLIEDRPAEVELRVVIWGCRALELPLDKESVDVLVRGSFEWSATDKSSGGKEPAAAKRTVQETDVHYGSTNGNTVYNWRMVWSNVVVPCNTGILTIQAIQFDPFGPETYIGEINIEMKSYLRSVAVNQEKLSYDVELKLLNRDAECVGFVQTTIQILMQTEGSARPVGLGQQNPNTDPPLSAPIAGRKWADFLGATKSTVSFDNVMLRIRWITVVLLLALVFFIGCIKPGIFWGL
ncbi:putative C2 domain protein, partial [Gregarina niphandrodes]